MTATTTTKADGFLTRLAAEKAEYKDRRDAANRVALWFDLEHAPAAAAESLRVGVKWSRLLRKARQAERLYEMTEANPERRERVVRCWDGMAG